MWGPLEEVAILGLPTQAAKVAGLDDRHLPAGPSSVRFTDAGELTGLLHGAALEDVELRELAFTLHVADFAELWTGVLGGTVRTAARLSGTTPAARERARRELKRLAEPLRGAGGYDLPTMIRVAVGRRG